MSTPYFIGATIRDLFDPDGYRESQRRQMEDERRKQQRYAEIDAAFGGGIDGLISGLTGGAQPATPPPPAAPTEIPQGITDEDLDFERIQMGDQAPLPVGALPRATPPPPQLAPPRPATPPPSRESVPLREDAKRSVSEREASEAQGGATVPPPTGNLERNPAAADVRSRLGFSWGKDVELNPATGRPTTNNLIRDADGNEIWSNETGSRGEGGYIMAGSDRPGTPYMPPSAAAEADELVQRLTSQRAAERLATGTGAAQPTAGELLEDQRRTAVTRDLAADRDQKLMEAQALLSDGRYTPEEYAVAVSEIKREFAMRTGIDPRYFTLQ